MLQHIKQSTPQIDLKITALWSSQWIALTQTPLKTFGQLSRDVFIKIEDNFQAVQTYGKQ